MKDSLPRILIIGQNFGETTGGEITLSNLFYNYPPEKLAVASTLIDSSSKNHCKHFYYLNSNEYAYKLFGFISVKNLKNLFIPSGINKKLHKYNEFANEVRKVNKFFLPIKRFLRFFFLKTRVITKDFRDWVEGFNPEIIYTQLGHPASIRFFELIRKKWQFPYAIHFMDDWQQKFISLQYETKIHKVFKNQIRDAACLMAICELMAKEYKKRYNRRFVSFHNPVNINYWKKLNEKKKYELKNKKFVLMFTGKLGRKSPSLFEVSKCVEFVRNRYKIPIIFEIYTNNTDSIEAEKLREYKGVTVNAFLTQDKLFPKLVDADVLLLPLSFEPNYVRVTKLSMPTKTTEYMVSGTPILVYAHPKTALNKYAAEYKWAYVVSERGLKALTKGIMELYNNYTLREKIGKRALLLAEKFYSRDSVSVAFQKCLIDSARK
ncbi:MAG: hypothetical protein K9L61_00850 [Candidatus Omnitrophica bacterium]|nr:hypothetical protein [Candidatus Omnitrophota bacterium]